MPSAKTARRETIRLGLLPSRDPGVPRTANIIKPKDHGIWKITRADALLAFLGESFPQIDDISALVSTEEAEAFVRSAPNRKPPVLT